MKRLFCTALIAGLSIGVFSCSGSNSPTNDKATEEPTTAFKYDAKIRYTEFGIPHIFAENWGSMGYGVGYAYANDNLCTLAEDIVTVDGERSKYFGPDGEHGIIGAFFATNRESDFAFKFLVNETKMDAFEAAQKPDTLEIGEGYVAGYNRYIRELRAGEHPGRHQACANESWLRELTSRDLLKRYLRLAMLASSTVFRDGIANAQPPVPTAATKPDVNESAQSPTADAPAFARLNELNDLPIGSNMYGLGRETTADGSTMLFGNPHFPWYGPERLHAFHITIPGVINSMGSGLHGVPVPLIAFNENFAWSHTVSAAYRFTVYELTLGPTPTSYLFDGQVVDMEPVEITIDVLNNDGSIGTESKTLYNTRYGPVTIVDPTALNWTTNKAYAIRDANYENTQLIEQFIEWNQASSLEEFIALQKSVLGVPWVNTVAVGPDQAVYYGDVTVVPNVPNSMINDGADDCRAEPVHSVVQNAVPGLPVLDGSRPECDWRIDADSPQAGIFGPNNLPTLRRNDWVHNCNDSYWLTNPAEPITGFARIIGDENAARSLRTRLCILQVQQRIAGTDNEADANFTLEQLQKIVLDSRVYTAELERDTVVTAICGAAPGGMLLASNGSSVDVTGACTALENWDMKTNRDSQGAHIWREFWTLADGTSLALWNTPYDNNDPVNTPRDLNTNNPEIRQAFADAVQTIQAVGVAMDSRFGDLQADVKNGERIEMYGGLGAIGNFTIAIPYRDRPHDMEQPNGRLPITSEGYPLITYGNSWVYTVQYKPGERVNAHGYVAYSQSTDPASPHYSDYTKAYANKAWPKLPFYEDEIAASLQRELRIQE